MDQVTKTQVEALRFEQHNGQHIPVGTLEAFAAYHKLPLERDEAGKLKRPKCPHVEMMKLREHGDKTYRLVWVYGAGYCLAAENTAPYRSKAGAVAAGAELAAKVGAEHRLG